MKFRVSAIISQIATSPLDYVQHLSVLLHCCPAPACMQFLLPLPPALGAAGDARAYLSCLRPKAWTRRQFIIGRQRQTTIHTLTRTYGQFRVPSWPHVLECEDGSQSIWEKTAKIRKKNSTQDHPRQRNRTRNLSCCEATPLTLSCNKSFHNKSRASPWIKRTLGNLKRRRVAR